jgi:coiled-coil and C2 domain-containing protein 2A
MDINVKKICLGLGDIWCNSQHVLDMMGGGEVEHAVLLTSYLLGLGRTAYLLLGRGVPEGRTAYALTVDQAGQERAHSSLFKH